MSLIGGTTGIENLKNELNRARNQIEALTSQYSLSPEFASEEEYSAEPDKSSIWKDLHSRRSSGIHSEHRFAA